MTLSPRTIEIGALEAATKHIYQDKGDRKGIIYVGWEQEPESVKEQWRADVRVSIESYLTALAAEGLVLVPKEPTQRQELAALADFERKNARGESQSYRDIYRAMLQAAQGGDEPLPSPREAT